MSETADTRRRAAIAGPLEVDPFAPPSAQASLEIAGVSVKGKLRATNTDHYLATKATRGFQTVVSSLAEADRPPVFEEHAYAMLVADGIGRGGQGARASRLALHAAAYLAIQYGKWNVRVDAENAAVIAQQIHLVFDLADEALRRESRSFPGTGLTTSLTLVAIAGVDLFFASVGDSKAFIFRAGKLIELTSDHLDPAAVKPVGADLGDADVAIKHTHLVDNDRLLLCTNGLTDILSQDEIADGLALRRRPAEDCQQLVNLALLNPRSHDDITAIVADYRID